MVQDSALLLGVYEYGMGSWDSIKNDKSFKLEDKILPNTDVKPQAKDLKSRVEYLIKALVKDAGKKEKKAGKNKTKTNSTDKNKINKPPSIKAESLITTEKR